MCVCIMNKQMHKFIQINIYIYVNINIKPSQFDVCACMFFTQSAC